MKMSRRTFLKRVLSGTAGILGIGAFGYSYARYLEPHMLQTKTYSITSEKIPGAFHNFKVLQFSDTHLGFHYDINQLNKLSETINGYEPDLLLLPAISSINPTRTIILWSLCRCSGNWKLNAGSTGFTETTTMVVTVQTKSGT